MAAQTWKLLDHATDHRENVSITAADVEGGAAGYAVSTRRLQAGLSDGVDVIRVDTGPFAFSILPTRGMSIWKGWLGEQEIGWKSPVRGPVHPKFVEYTEPSGLGWLDGFDEWLVRCGLESNGAPEFDDDGRLAYPLHGRIGNKPAHDVSLSVDGETGKITVTGVVEECRFHFLKLRMTSTISTTPGRHGFTIHDKIENLSASDAEFQMLYHINFGLPMLDAGSQFVAPVKTVVPRNDHAASGIANWSSYGAEEPGFEEQVYFLELLADDAGNSRAMLKNAHGTLGASMGFNTKQLPCYTVWKNTTAGSDGCVTGLEPGTNFPNPRTFEGENQRVVKLAGGGSWDFNVDLDVLPNQAAVEAEEAKIQELQGDTSAKVYDKPQKRWCHGV